VVENCGALPDTLLESELFGHKKGAFTGAVSDRAGRFQEADRGTLFLDEIGETSPAFQVKLLRVLQEGEIRPLGSNRCQQVDVRVIAATNRDLKAEVAAGRFREDLYYRLATVPLHVPPLRERPMDIPLLAEGILRRAAQRLGRPVEGFDPGLLACLQAYPWPGNVRELMNEIQRMLALSDGPILGADLLAPQVLLARLAQTPSQNQTPDGTPGASRLRAQVDSLESQMVRAALQRHGGNISRTAEELGLSRLGLRKKMARLGLP
jgi:two-component system response regulator HupR/HoxA